MKMKRSLSILMVVMLVLMSTACSTTKPAVGKETTEPTNVGSEESGGLPADGPEYEFIYADDVAETTLRGQMIKYLANLLEERSGGKMKILRHHATLGQIDELTDNIRNGSIDMYAVALGSLQGDEFAVLDIPMIYSDLDKATEIMTNSKLRDMLEERCEANNMKMLLLIPANYRLITSNKELDSFEDFKGLKIRTPGNPAWVEFWKTTGANPTPLILTEVYMSLQQGLVDAQENPYDLILTQRFTEVQDYIIYTNHLVNVISWQFNLEKWNSLPKEYQTMFEECVAEALKYSLEIRDRENAGYEEQVVKTGIKQIFPNDEFKAKLLEASEASIPLFRELAGDEIVDITLSSLGLDPNLGKK